MLSKEKARDQALLVYNEFYTPDRRRLDRIKRAIEPPLDGDGIPKARVELPEDSPELLQTLAAEAETNYLPLLIETYSQVMIVDDYITKGVPETNPSDGTPVPRSSRDPWETWQRNRMDSRQLSLHRAACTYGTAYATVVPGRADDGQDFAVVRTHSPLTMTAIYEDEEMDDWPVWGLSVTDQHWVLYSDTEYHIFGVEEKSPLIGGPKPIGTLGPTQQGRWLSYIEGHEHTLGVTPIIRYRDRHYLPDETVRGMVEPLLAIQRRIDRTSVNQMVAQQIAIFRQKYSIGWVPEDEEEEVKASIAKMHYIDRDPSEVQLGEWEATDIEPYIAAGNQARRDFSATGQIPAQSMGIDGISNISDATLAGLEAAKNRRSGIATTSLGESHEQLMRTFATIDGNTIAANDFSSEVVWRDFESRSFAQTIDGLLKLTTMGLPAEIAMEDVPGFSGQKLERIRKSMRRERARATIAAAAAPTTTSPGGQAAQQNGDSAEQENV